MTPLRAAILLALEQECRFLAALNNMRTTDQAAVRYGAAVFSISSRIEYPGLVRASAIRKVLSEEKAAGTVLHLDEGPGLTHRWWPVGLTAKLADERTQAQREWNAALVRLTAHLQVSEHVSREAAEQMARVRIEREKGRCP